MRLLECSDGKFYLTKDFLEQDAPEYAILSHVWGADTEEVTYSDVVDGTGGLKYGWKKIRFCAEQAKRDGLKYFWVDTCCIDKSDLNELSRSINSMFRWYQNATRCYVYLPGIFAANMEANMEGVQRSNTVQDPMFRSHLWFTRGWTLQELVAPSSVEFFTEDGQRLGDKRSLEQQVSEITGISVSVLRGTALSEFSVEERFKWAERRQTTHEEDWAYCLLGIFGIFMPLIYGEGKTHAVRRLRKEITDAMNNGSRETMGSQVSNKNAIWMVPFERNASFTGREAELRRLRQLLATTNNNNRRTSKVAVTGLGGVGKTQLALEFLHLMRGEMPDCSIFWLAATSKEALDQSFFNMAQRLGLPGCDSPETDVKGLVQTHLTDEFAGKWLLAFDNADDIGIWLQSSDGKKPGRLVDYLPKSDRGSILFTTRDKKAAVALAGSNVIQLSEMDEAGSETLLRKHLIDGDIDDTQEDISALLSRLTYLPLAIVQAAAYINANGTSLGVYLSLLGEAQEEDIIELLSEDFEDDTRYPHVANAVATTWLISFEQIRKTDPLAAEYLCLMACVESKDIPQTLLPTGPSRKQGADAMGTLKGYSFIAMQPANSAFTIHRLVHLATRNWLRKGGLMSTWERKASKRLCEVVGRVEPGGRGVWKPFLPHIHHVLASSRSKEDVDPWLLNTYGLCLQCEGRPWEAVAAFERAVQVNTTTLGPEHEDTLRLTLELALGYRQLDRWGECEKLCTRLWEPLQTHPDLAVKRDLFSLRGTVLMQQGRVAEAEKPLARIFEMYKSAYGVDCLETITSMLELSSVYLRAGRCAKAENLLAQVVEAGERVLGIDHPITMDGVTRMAFRYQDRGEWDEAERLLIHVAEIMKRKYGEGHIWTAMAIVDLAQVWKRQGRLEEAITSLQGCVDCMVLVWGPDDVVTVRWRKQLTEWQLEERRSSWLSFFRAIWFG